MPPLRLVKLSDADVTVNVAPPGLTQTAADTLGNELTAADGFDAIMQDIASAISADWAWVKTWDTLTEAADFPGGQISATLLWPLISDFALFAASGDAQAADLDATISRATPAIAPPQKPPNTTAPVITAPVSGPPIDYPTREPVYIPIGPIYGGGPTGPAGCESYGTWGTICPPSEQ